MRWPKFKNPHDLSREEIIHRYTQWKENMKKKLRDKATHLEKNYDIATSQKNFSLAHIHAVLLNEINEVLEAMK